MSDEEVKCQAAGELGCVDHCGHRTEHEKKENCSVPCGNRRLRAFKDDGTCCHVDKKPKKEITES